MIADEVLMHANLRAFSDPDPDRAFRFRPYAYGSVRDAARIAEVAPPVSLRQRVVTLRDGALAAVPRLAPVARPTAASQCPACC